MYRHFFKRVIDLAVSIPMFLVLLPFLLIIAFVLCIRNKQVMFLQERIGRGCRKFKVIKFCTMTNDTDADGNLLPDKERITAFGEFLRKFSLDELPQLLNIIKGDMSLIGPRPFMERYIANCNDQQLRRHEVRPGVTGLAQVCGRNSVSYEHRFKYDVWYVDNYSFRVDIMILFLTAKMVLGLDKDNNSIEYDPMLEEKWLNGIKACE